MQTSFEVMGGTYRQEGDYLLPNVKAPESPAIGIWGQRRHKYLMEHNHALYTALFLSGKLTTHLEEIDRAATQMFDQLVDHLKTRNGVTEQLKATDQMKWVLCINNLVFYIYLITLKLPSAKRIAAQANTTVGSMIGSVTSIFANKIGNSVQPNTSACTPCAFRRFTMACTFSGCG